MLPSVIKKSIAFTQVVRKMGLLMASKAQTIEEIKAEAKRLTEEAQRLAEESKRYTEEADRLAIDDEHIGQIAAERVAPHNWEGWLAKGDRHPVIYYLKMGDNPISRLLWLTVVDPNKCIWIDDQGQRWQTLRGWGIMWTLLGPDGTRYHVDYNQTFGKVIEGDNVNPGWQYYVPNGVDKL